MVGAISSGKSESRCQKKCMSNNARVSEVGGAQGGGGLLSMNAVNLSSQEWH